jgi:DNA topoisomerase-1
MHLAGATTKRAHRNAVQDAQAAHLRHVSDRAAGITRRRLGSGFVYRDKDGRIIAERAELERIGRIAIPPAWTNVWICPDPRGHIQAVGRDARGRKQYRYHPRWRALRDSNKFHHILRFGQVLPRIRRRVRADLATPGLPREKVIAAVIQLMELTLARVGNVEYERENHSFGLTTLKNRHVQIKGGRIELNFLAKSNVRHHTLVSDRKLARILRNCRELPGSELFQYLDEAGQRHSIDSSDVNDYLRSISSEDVTAKDFRTWAATNLAFTAFCALDEKKPSKKSQLQVIRQVAQQLGNTVAVCRKCYIHPVVLNGYLDGSLQGSPNSVDLEAKYPGAWVEERKILRLLRSTIGRTGTSSLAKAA